ncbi:CCHC-type domain-containing protein [Abeliophyllum distichum]|uniref:CCHC-type domain-containing protein n=1 Tax=Abeliophyllum distichum TaxID=126358 RepID=A0ABD1SDP0_9LAMI
MKVSKYVRKFEDLSHFATHMVETNGMKVDCFLEGLRAELNSDALMSGIQNMSFPKIINKALLAEQAEVKIVRAREARDQNQNQNMVNKNWNENKKKWARKRQGEEQNKPYLKNKKPDNQRETKNVPLCTKCGKRYPGKCWA